MRRVLFVALTSVLAGLAALSLLSLPRAVFAQPNLTPPADLAFTAHLSPTLPLAVAPTNTNAFPDPSIAADDDTVVTTSNTGVRISTTGGGLVAATDLASFFTSVTPPPIIYNTRTTFWAPLGRFVVCATALDLGMSPVSRLLVAVSDDADPANLTTDWSFYTHDTGRTTMMTLTDYSVISGIGWATNRFLVAFDNFSLATGQFTDNDVYGFNNADLTAGPLSVDNIDSPNQPASYAGGGIPAYHLQPVQGEGGTRLFSVGNPFAGSVQDRITAYATDADGEVTGATDVELVTPWQSPPNAAAKGSLDGIPQSDVLTKVVSRGTRHWFAQTVQATTPPARPVVRFYYYDSSGGGTVTEVAETSDPTLGYYMPSVAPDLFGNAIGVFHGSDANSTIAVYHQRFLQNGVSVQQQRLTSVSGTTFDVALQNSPFHTPWGGFADAAPNSGSGVWTHAELALDCERWKTEVYHHTTRSITLLDPDGGQTFHLAAAGPPAVAADTITITWTPGATGPGDSIRIHFSPDGGATWPTLVTASTADDGVHTVSAGSLGGVTTQGRFRVQVVNGGVLVGSLEDASDADFTITVRNTTTAASAHPPIPIPDNWQNDGDWVESPLFLPDDLTIHGLTVTVTITHAYIPDLEVYLQHPDGSEVVLHDQTGIPGQPPGGTPPAFGTRTYPSPTAPDADGGGAAGVTRFNNTFLLKRSRGWTGGVEKPWLLRVRDLNPGSIGSLVSWSLSASGPPTKRLDVTRPDGGEQFVVGQNELLTWQNDPNNPVQGNVDIRLSRNGGADGFPEVLNGLPIPVDAEQFNWTVTGPITQNALIRVVPLDEGPDEPFDQSAAAFRIRDPFVEVTHPNAPGITLLTGAQTTVTWNRFPASGDVLIELLNADTMALVDTLAASTPNDGSFDWTPTSALAAGLIRITPLGMGAPPADLSDNPFCITTKGLTVSAPGAPGPTSVDVDTNTNIDWTTSGIAGNVHIELTRDGGMNWETIAAAVGHGSAPFNWLVTGPPTTQAKVRVTSLSDPTITDTGDTFTIRQATLEITRPVAADKLAISSIFDIQWNSTAPLTGADNVAIDLSRNGGAWEPISASTPNDGSFKWTVTGPVRDSCVLRIRSLAYPSTSDLSDTFPIISPSLTVVQPNGGEGLGIGSVYKIKWTSFPLHDGVDNLSKVRIFISRTGLAGAFTEEITPMGGVFNTGEFDWTVTGPETTTAAIEIQTFLSGDMGATFNVPAPFPEQTDRSDAVFRIDDQEIVVGQPTAGEKLFIGLTKTIQWSTVGVPGNVRILVQRGMSSTEITPMGGVPADQGTFDWLVAAPAHTGAVIRVESIADSMVFGTSGAFDIVAIGLSITQPNGHVWGIGTQQKIKWTSAGGFTGMAEVLLQKNGEMMASSLGSAAMPGGNGELDYTVSGPTGPFTVFVRINGTMPLEQTSSGGTIVTPGITVTAPTLNQKLRTGQPTSITWVHSGLDQEIGGPGNVKISVIRDGGSPQTIIASTPNDGEFTWNPVQPPDSNNVQIRVESVELPSVFDLSDTCQIVTPALNITAPTEGASVVIGEILNINWTANEVAGPLDIELTRNGGMSWETIATGVNPADGTFAWLVTGDGGGNGSTNNRIRLTDTGVTAAQDEMDGPFTIIKPTITVGFPNGGQNIVVNTTQTITWTNTGIPPGANVLIELLQGGGVVQTIAASTPNDGSHSWTPTLTGVDFKIRISRIGSPAASDESNSSFTVIAPTLTVTAPNGGEKVKKKKLLAITWTSNTIGAVGGGGLVDILLSTDGGATFTVIIQDTANDGSANWLVDVKPTKKARIRVVWKPNPAVADSSNANFQITK